MRKARRRLWIIAAAAIVLAGAGALASLALRDAMVFFYAPGDIAENPPQAGQHIRVGGLVVEGSVERPAEGGANFAVTDGRADLRIVYRGSLPDLFREGQGIVAEGSFGEDGVFVADTVLAKHDESYMPPEVADALKESGLWEESGRARSSGYEYRPAAREGETGR
ncbi:cytochrome c maturation protein CcmE [Marinicauda algicola]|uniref:Cytochrome c-type biogenesis protein CcmE n=1 Tax=Marinicauda algicola TaxID=2029849 RepID=A0A4S2H3X3_9PROT|nr:cytochrome c maturation protein CcmE [Marinicauda algicola]TGY89972.1 cytochrome c maturation protein CcmE [Marinicauda algicola]